jgi:DNA-binding YbaB/EbfC family protein
VDSMKNLQQLFQMGQQMQSRMTELQKRLASETVTTRSGGGMVEVTVDGTGDIKSIKLDPAVVDPEDVEMLEDLVLAAVSEAQRRAKEKVEEEMRQATGGMAMPGLSQLLGG